MEERRDGNDVNERRAFMGALKKMRERKNEEDLIRR